MSKNIWNNKMKMKRMKKWRNEKKLLYPVSGFLCITLFRFLNLVISIIYSKDRFFPFKMCKRPFKRRHIWYWKKREREKKYPLVTSFENTKIGARAVSWIRIKLIWVLDPAILTDRHPDTGQSMVLILNIRNWCVRKEQSLKFDLFMAFDYIKSSYK